MLHPNYDPAKNVVVLGGGYVLENIHSASLCSGRDCVIHHIPPTMHTENMHWRADRGIWETICKHGIGHPHPAQYDYWKSRWGKNMNRMADHGCSIQCGKRCHGYDVVDPMEMF